MDKPNTPNPATAKSGGQQLPALSRPALPATSRPGIEFAVPNDGLTPRKILAAVRYWWKLALPLGLILGGVAAAVVFSQFKPQYQATAWLRIEDDPPFLAFHDKGGDSRSKSFVKTQIELFRSPMVLGPVVAQREVNSLPELANQENPIEWLTRAVAINSIGGSELYTVSFTCSQAKPAAMVVNAVLDSYFRVRAAEHGQRIERVIKVLNLERTAREAEVDALRKGVRELAKQVTGRDPFQTAPQPTAPEGASVIDLGNRLIAMEVEESLLRAKINGYERSEATAQAQVPAEVVEQAVESHPQVVDELTRLTEKKLRLQQFAEKAVRGMEEPAYQRVAKEVMQEEAAIEQLKVALRGQIEKQLQAKLVGQMAAELASLRANLAEREATRELLQQRYEQELKTRKQSTGDTIDLRFKQEELARAERVLDLISERIVQLKTEQGAPPRVWEMERAKVPPAPVKGMPYTNMLVAFAIGLCAPFGLAVLKEQIAARVVDPEVLERRAKLAVLGEISQLPTQRAGMARLGTREHRARCLFEESVDAMRTNLLLSQGAHTLRFIAVASAVNEEGKTTVAVQLASSIARSCGVRTLVIDGDLRSPSIHSVFEVLRGPGLTDVLAGTISLREAISITRVEGVDVLPAGVLNSNPHALLASGRWEALLKRIPSEYKYVVIDTPPVLAASEALTLVRSADTVLMCALRDVSRMPQLQKAAARIAATGARMGGLILNGIPASHYASRYGTYSYLLDS